MNLLNQVISATSTPEFSGDKIELVLNGDGNTHDVYAVTDLAAYTIGVASMALARYAGANRVFVDKRLSSFWFHSSFRPSGNSPPKAWDEFSGDYRTRDGWIRLHTNVLAHREAAKRVLDNPLNRANAEKIVKKWNGLELQETVVGAGGASAVMYSEDQWSDHPQGKAVSGEPLVTWSYHGKSRFNHEIHPDRPLKGLKVLDLTRILAGPVATRFLASYGAQVLRIDPPGWEEIGNIPEMTPGKRCTTLDLSRSDHKSIFSQLLTKADILVHGYRADALERLGIGDDIRRAINPGLIDVALNAYGWTGPWNKRRGFDSLVQMSSGIAKYGMITTGDSKPHPLTVQALDHATGYLMATSILNALCHLRDTGRIMSARLSLAATAELIKQFKPQGSGSRFGNELRPEDDNDLLDTVHNTAWGPTQRLKFPMQVEQIHAFWNTPETPLHSDEPKWL